MGELQQVLLNFNSISVEKSQGANKITEELQEQLVSKQLVNFQGITDSLIDILNFEYFEF